MSQIQVLDESTIDKIAAGEVIERPASVVKELVENAIDSGASAITIEVKEGGISLIRITDNGCGIEAEDVPTAFLRHATSKIRTATDLLNIHSLGFRGEALSSISAVAQVELITKTAAALMGVRYQIAGSKEISLEHIGCPEGTTFIVRNLFYNVPARQKFLKTPQTEGAHIYDLVQQLALSHPEISFQFIMNGQNRFHTSGNGNMQDIIYSIYGKEVAQSLLPVSLHNEELEVSIEGYIGKPIVSRGNRTFENYYINQRYIKSNVIYRAIEEAYKNFTMIHKFPFVCLSFTMNPEHLDVNVHPTKMDLRFRNERYLFEYIKQEIRKILFQKDLIPDVDLTKESKKKTVEEKKIRGAQPFEAVRRKQEQVLVQKAAEQDKKEQPYRSQQPVVNKEITKIQKVAEESTYRTDSRSASPAVTDPLPVEPTQMRLQTPGFLEKEARAKHRVIGQLFKTYWLIEYDGKLFIMDQHAAHEKVNYERFMKHFRDKKKRFVQQVSPPIILTLSPKEAAAYTEYQNYFADFGFEIEPYGGNEYCIRGVPTDLYGIADQDAFIELLDELIENLHGTDTSMIADKIATMACKASVKGNQRLTLEEADHLIDELLTLDSPFTCPHGRPTIISMTQTEIERKFKRIQN